MNGGMVTAVLPPPVEPGDLVAVAAPASPFDPGRLDRGLAVIREMGFEVWTPSATFGRRGYLAGSDDERAASLSRLFREPDVRAILCARGGYGAMRTAARFEFDAASSHPKRFVGFSDITAMLWGLRARSGLVTFHGPVVTALSDAPEASRESFRRALTARSVADCSGLTGAPLRGGRAVGPLLGGNLTTLCHLIGTPLAPRWEGGILFLEDRGEALYRIDRMLTQMRLAGVLDGVVGVALGGFTDCGSVDQVHEIVTAAFSDPPIPVLGALEAGHGPENRTFPLGATAILDADAGVLSFSNAEVTAG